MDAKAQISALLKQLSEGVFEKQHILAVALLSTVAGESIFLLGPPGTAKSLVARRLKLAFKDGKSFEYLMSRFSTPDEIFGPVSISLLKNEDRYERVADSTFATGFFADEFADCLHFGGSIGSESQAFSPSLGQPLPRVFALPPRPT